MSKAFTVIFTVSVCIGRLVSATTNSPGMLTADDLRDVDEKIVDYLEEGRVTPAYARRRLEADYDEEYSRGYVQQRLGRLQEHSHVRNLYETGLYELTDNPRDRSKN